MGGKNETALKQDWSIAGILTVGDEKWFYGSNWGYLWVEQKSNVLG